MKYRALDLVWKYECPLRICMKAWALDSGTGFGMEI